MFIKTNPLLFEEIHLQHPSSHFVGWCIQHDAIEEFSTTEMDDREFEFGYAQDCSVDKDFERITQFYKFKEFEVWEEVATLQSPSLKKDVDIFYVESSIHNLVSFPNFDYSENEKTQENNMTTLNKNLHDEEKYKLLSTKEELKLLKLREKLCKLLNKRMNVDFDLIDLQGCYNEAYWIELAIERHQKIKEFDDEHNIEEYFPELYAYNLENLHEKQEELFAVNIGDLSLDDESSANDNDNFTHMDDDSVHISRSPIHALNEAKTKQNKFKRTSYTNLSTEKRNIHKDVDCYFEDFIGLEVVRNEVKKIIAFLEVQKMREAQGYAMKPTQSRHMVFTGNPGTGKTEMARLIAKIMYDKGIVNSDVFVEADRSDLIAEYLGQTALKTKVLIQKSFGGVLFIDEAYTLKNGKDDMYGEEAIATLLKMIEDNRDKLTVIVAGYENEMETFIQSNPGLKSRFNRFIEFPDYENEELFEILLKMAESNHYRILNIKDTKKIMNEYLNNERDTAGGSFANARFVRNYFEKVIEQQSLRVINQKVYELNNLIIEDFYI